MGIGKKRALSALFVGFGLTVCAGAYCINMHTVQAESLTFGDIAGQSFTNEDYQFSGYSLGYEKNGAVNSNSAGSSFRFKMQISERMQNYISETAGVTTGTLIYPAYYLNGAELTADFTAGENNDIVPLNLDTTSSWTQAEGADSYQSVAYLKEIPAKFYGAKIAVRGYLKAGDKYYYTQPTPARSFSWVVNEEYSDEESVFTAQEKREIKELFCKFPITVDGVTQIKYYGDTVETPEASGEPHRIFLYYEQDGKAFTPGISKLIGRANLTSVYANIENFYSREEGKATFDAEGIPAGITTAKLNGDTVSCTTQAGKISVQNLDLEMGGNYLLVAQDNAGNVYRVAFKYVAKINDNVPYAANDELVYDLGGRDIAYIDDLNGVEIITDGGRVLTGISANNSKEVAEKEALITDTAGDVHKITLRVFSKVLYSDEDARAFFVGDRVKAALDEEERYFSLPGFKKYRAASIGLANDVNLGNIPESHGAYQLSTLAEAQSYVKNNTSSLERGYVEAKDDGGNVAGYITYYVNGSGIKVPSYITFSGFFDGCGHAVSWTVDGGDGSHGRGSLFGYYMNGTLQNAELDVTYKNVTQSTTCFIIAESIWSDDIYNAETNPEPIKGRIDNMFFNVRLGENTDDDKVKIVLGGANKNYGMHLTDCLMVRTGNTSKYGSSTKLLFDYVFSNTDSDLEKFTNGFTNAAGTTLYEVKREYVNTENVVCIIPDGDLVGLLGYFGYNRYYAGINQQDTEDIDGSDYWYSNGFFHDTYIYNYTQAKTAERALKVGNWVVSYGETIEDVTATFVK